MAGFEIDKNGIPRTSNADHLTGRDRDAQETRKPVYVTPPIHPAHDNDAQKLGMGHAVTKDTPGFSPLDKEALSKPAASQGVNVADHPAMKRGQAGRSDPDNLGPKVLDNAELKIKP